MNDPRWKRWTKGLLITYCLTGILLYTFQEIILFRNTSLSKQQDWAFKRPFREINLAYTNEANLNIVQFLPTNPDSTRRGVVLYLHGNRKNIGWYEKYAELFTSTGHELWMIDYPGYGKSTGERSEESLYAFADQLYKLARTRFPEDSIIIYGKSLGTGIATWLAARRPCKHLILETPYYSLPSIIDSWLPIYPTERMMRIKIPTHEYIREVRAPITIFHGTADWTVPYRNAQKLVPLLKSGDEFITIPGGSHNDLFTFPLCSQKLDEILKN